MNSWNRWAGYPVEEMPYPEKAGTACGLPLSSGFQIAHTFIMLGVYPTNDEAISSLAVPDLPAMGRPSMLDVPAAVPYVVVPCMAFCTKAQSLASNTLVPLLGALYMSLLLESSTLDTMCKVLFTPLLAMVEWPCAKSHTVRALMPSTLYMEFSSISP